MAREIKFLEILTGLDISTSQFTGGSEVNTDEFTLDKEEERTKCQQKEVEKMCRKNVS